MAPPSERRQYAEANRLGGWAGPDVPMPGFAPGEPDAEWFPADGRPSRGPAKSGEENEVARRADRGIVVPARAAPAPVSPSRLVVTDLDGTLLDSASRLSDVNRRTLETLARNGTVRAVATGRSLYSARLVMHRDFPVDYLAFSSGAGIVSWPDGRLLRSPAMDSALVARLVARLRGLGLDFMVQRAAPDSHRFHFVRSSRRNADFEHRVERYRRYARPLHDGTAAEFGVSQFVVVEPPGTDTHLELLTREFEDVHVVRTTSPLDHASTWIELFPEGVSKAHASDWIRERHAIQPGRTVAVGNDYNDLDMLEWAAHAFVVSNAPSSMRERFAVVRANDDDGFTEAVRGLPDGG